MPIEVAVPRSMVERKPPHGSPCNRCGACCFATLCPLGQKVFGREIGPCPALLWSPGNAETGCGLVVAPAKFYPLAALRAGAEQASRDAGFLVGSGTGCDARINGEKPNQQFYRDLEQWDRDNAAAVAAARITWGVR